MVRNLNFRAETYLFPARKWTEPFPPPLPASANAAAGCWSPTPRLIQVAESAAQPAGADRPQPAKALRPAGARAHRPQPGAGALRPAVGGDAERLHHRSPPRGAESWLGHIARIRLMGESWRCGSRTPVPTKAWSGASMWRRVSANDFGARPLAGARS